MYSPLIFVLDGSVTSRSTPPSPTLLRMIGVMTAVDLAVCLFVDIVAFVLRFFLMYGVFFPITAEGESKMFFELCDP